ncbi:MAG: hypothetical protein IPM57_05165 [Oligoflexia bacterium]|nr:hypothetical protein [Oligoflexia bacterium]
MAVDRGAEQLGKIKADLFVGDGDSIVKKPNAQKTIWLNPRKSISDLEFVLKHLPKNKTKLILSSHLNHESRVDHSFINLLLTLKYKNIFLADEDNTILSFKGKYKFKLKKRAHFSVVSIKNIKLSLSGGAEYKCKNKSVNNLTFGLSNKAKANKAVTIKVNKQSLLIINTDFGQVN